MKNDANIPEHYLDTIDYCENQTNKIKAIFINNPHHWLSPLYQVSDIISNPYSKHDG